MNNTKANAELTYTKKYITPPRHSDIIFAAACIFGLLCFFLSLFIFGKDGGSLDIFYVSCNNFIYDFVATIGFSAKFDPYNCTIFTGVWDKAYPPMGYLITQPLYKLVDIEHYSAMDNFALMAYEPYILLVYIMITVIFAVMLYETIRINIEGTAFRRAVFAAVLTFSMPVWYVIERGNICLLAAIALAVFVFFYESKNPIIKETALLSLAFSFSLKLSPAVFGFLLILKKQYKEAFRTAVYGILMLILPFLYFKGGLANIPLFFRNVSMHAARYGYYGDTGLHMCLEHCGFILLTKLSDTPLRYLLAVYLLVCCFFYKRKWEIITAITIVLLITPAHSFLYVLNYTIPAAVYFINEKEFRKADWAALIGFIAIFMMPLKLFSGLNFIGFDYHYGIVILLALMTVYGTQNISAAVSQYFAKHNVPAFVPKTKSFCSAVKKKAPAAITICIVVLLLVTAIVCAASSSIRTALISRLGSVLFGDIIPYAVSFSKLLYNLLIIGVLLLIFFAAAMLAAKCKEQRQGTAPITAETHKEGKKTSKIRFFILLILLGLTAAFAVLSRQPPEFSMEICRRCGIEQYNRGNYIEAFNYFDSVSDYSDCNDYMDKCLEKIKGSGHGNQ